MSQDNSPPRTFKGLLRWATTPPQARASISSPSSRVWLVSFYAGMLKPKKTPDASPATVTAPKG